LKGSRFIEAKKSPGPGDYEISKMKSERNFDSLKSKTRFSGSKRVSMDSIDSSGSPKRTSPGPGDYEIEKVAYPKYGPAFIKVS